MRVRPFSIIGQDGNEHTDDDDDDDNENVDDGYWQCAADLEATEGLDLAAAAQVVDDGEVGDDGEDKGAAETTPLVRQ